MGVCFLNFQIPFWNNFRPQEVVKIESEFSCTFHPVSLSDNILHSYTTLSKLGKGHWYNTINHYFSWVTYLLGLP